MTLNKILRNTFLVLMAGLIFTDCAPQKKVLTKERQKQNRNRELMDF